VTDHEEIATLLFTYAALVDAGDFTGVGTLFEHATFRAATPSGDVALAQGSEGARRNFAVVQLYEDGTPRTKHVTTNVIVEVDDDAGTARSRSYFSVLQAVPGKLPLQVVVAGRYHDTFERVDGRWRFTDRLILTDLVGDVSAHLAPGVL
jgi:3-phenylpropionate/cinnamic acid dioxygenase small subunit